ncbi:Asp23/Gls24 family envelope stress response protein [Limosilactobacillus caecicola]|uniref:Asp23/Gls24 family envelope stress response protein n=1 Tax=Limosilactobacillus caecicola TaxID=2941332 RepID=UPI00203E600C|nr:Asp23/Gls24 family envelope stress response protein [Limosilactobacillus caecicola]
MAEESKIVLSSEDQSLGTIQISPRVLEFIAGIAASQVDGVAKMYGSLATNVGELLGRSDHRRGVKLTRDDDNQLTIDVAVYLEYGVAVPQVAAKIQQTVKQRIASMTDLKVSIVNVHVQGINTEKPESGIDPNDIFGTQSQDEDGE